MDDSEIERLLKDSWRPKPPHGMRKRVLDAARQDLRRRPARWKIALATCGILIGVIGNVSDHALQPRMAAMLNGRKVFDHAVTPMSPENLTRRRLALDRLLALRAVERGSADWEIGWEQP